MSRDRALWRKVFDAVEGPAGRRLHDGLHRDDFIDVLTIAKRLQVVVGRRVEGASTLVLHALNIPARRDVRRAAAQLTQIQRELRAISHELADQRSRPLP